MAYFGLSLIEAINEVLESVGEPPWGQTDHPSEAGDSTSIARTFLTGRHFAFNR